MCCVIVIISYTLFCVSIKLNDSLEGITEALAINKLFFYFYSMCITKSQDFRSLK
jgi:hypothetical protein